MQPITNEFYGFLKQGKIMGLQCGECNIVLLPPRGVCPECGGFKLGWVQLSGRGELLYASAGTHRMMDIEFVLGTVKLEEGPVVPGMVLIDDFDFSKSEKIWEYNRAGISVMAEVFKNPLEVESIAFRIVE